MQVCTLVERTEAVSKTMRLGLEQVVTFPMENENPTVRQLSLGFPLEIFTA
jgi:hypothetical protein